MTFAMKKLLKVNYIFHSL